LNCSAPLATATMFFVEVHSTEAEALSAEQVPARTEVVNAVAATARATVSLRMSFMVLVRLILLRFILCSHAITH
jgi:hypothetical protein